jgi:hypothetical protein
LDREEKEEEEEREKNRHSDLRCRTRSEHACISMNPSCVPVPTPPPNKQAKFSAFGSKKNKGSKKRACRNVVTRVRINFEFVGKDMMHVCVCCCCVALITISYITRVQEKKGVVIHGRHGRALRHLYEYPLAASLDEFIQHHGHVGQDEAADVEAEELCGVAG